MKYPARRQRKRADAGAYCIVMHTNDVVGAQAWRKRRVVRPLLNAWREAPIYSARERAALAWTEAVTKISDHHVPDEIYDKARRHFSGKGTCGSHRCGGCDQRLEWCRDCVSSYAAVDKCENCSVIK